MSNKHLILDTTYILPLFGIRIKELYNFKNISVKLFSKGLKGFRIYLPTVCLLEVMYKLNGEYRKKKDIDILNRYSITLPSILSSKVIELFNPLLNPETNKVATNIRHAGHNDIMDCLIAASAKSLNGTLMSEDIELWEVINKIPKISDIPIWSWDDFVEKDLV